MPTLCSCCPSASAGVLHGARFKQTPVDRVHNAQRKAEAVAATEDAAETDVGEYYGHGYSARSYSAYCPLPDTDTTTVTAPEDEAEAVADTDTYTDTDTATAKAHRCRWNTGRCGIYMTNTLCLISPPK